MSLQHILTTINQKADEEAKKIIQEAKNKEAEIIENANKKAKAVKEDVLEDLKKKTEEKIEKAKRKSEIIIKNKIISKKREILDLVFNKASKKLSKQTDILKNLYISLIDNLPKELNEAYILTNAESEKIISQILSQKNINIPVKPEIKEPGFIFVSGQIEIDNRLSKLIDKIREDAEIEMSKLLFKK